jgi:hypothetical protein
MAPYKYKDESWRGKVFSDRGLWTDEKRAAADTRTPPPDAARGSPAAATAPAPHTHDADSRPSPSRARRRRDSATESTGDFNVHGDCRPMPSSAPRSATTTRTTVGTVQDLYLDASGAIKTVVVSVGGFLGVGAKDVAIKWSDLKQSRDGKSLVLMTNPQQGRAEGDAGLHGRAPSAGRQGPGADAEVNCSVEARRGPVTHGGGPSSFRRICARNTANQSCIGDIGAGTLA